jgi:protein-S-isoprenylcysteine O-methyltransferase Ste14
LTLRRAALQTAATLVLMAIALFGAAGRLDWGMAWAFLAAYVLFAVVALSVVDRELIAARADLHGGARSDLVLGAFFSALLYPATLVLAGLDARYGWSPALPAALEWIALAVFLAGYGLMTWCMRVNRFFIAVVRVQTEREHRVIEDGPYRFVRHPGYTGGIVAHLALPIALGSLVALLPAALGCALIAVRTFSEERTLMRDLPGYTEYRRKVRWRLVPGVF